MSAKVSAPSQLWAQLLPPVVPNPFSQNEMPWQEPTVHAVYLDLGQCGMKMFKGEAELTAQKWCNLCHGRERERQREGWDGWEQWRAAATGVSGVGLNHPQVSLSSWEAGSWPAACSESHASGLGAKLPLQAITADRFCQDVHTTQSEPPQNGKEVAVVATCRYILPHVYPGLFGTMSLGRNIINPMMYCVRGSVCKVGKNSCWWQKL